MGGILAKCCGCCDKNDDESNGDVNERTRLLSGSESMQTPNTDLPNGIYGNGFNIGSQYSRSLPKHLNEEQNALSTVYQDTATSLIDISATVNNNLIESREYMDRAFEYGRLLQQHAAAIAGRHLALMAKERTPFEVEEEEEELPESDRSGSQVVEVQVGW